MIVFFRRLLRLARFLLHLAQGLFQAGALFGFWLGSYWLEGANTLWLQIYGPLSQGLMMGLLGWTIYDAISSTRVVAELHRQPLRIDLFDINPFEPMGRQSLVVALVFAGGFLLEAIFSITAGNIYSWLVNRPMMFVPVLVFFLSMRHTHDVLAREKKQQLKIVNQRINQISQGIQSGAAGVAAAAPAVLAAGAYLIDRFRLGLDD